MSHKTQILDLIQRLDELPVRQESLLRGFLVDLKIAIKDIFGPSNQYLDYLKFVKFRPDAVFVTERELQRSWLSGRAQVSNLLRVILNDPLVRGDDPPELPLIEPLLSEEALSVRRFSDIQDSILGVIGDFQKEMLARPAAEEEGPIKEALRKDYFKPASESAQAPTDVVNNSVRIFVVPGTDRLVNQEILQYLNSFSAAVIQQEDDRRRGESLLDHLNRCAPNDFVVFILSADFYFYPRIQSPDSARLMAAQEMIFQLGFLVAKLGRERVVVIYQEADHFRRPTDYFDIYYVPLSSNTAWKEDLAKRLKLCGITVSSESGLPSVQGMEDPV